MCKSFEFERQNITDKILLQVFKKNLSLSWLVFVSPVFTRISYDLLNQVGKGYFEFEMNNNIRQIIRFDFLSLCVLFSKVDIFFMAKPILEKSCRKVCLRSRTIWNINEQTFEGKMSEFILRCSTSKCVEVVQFFRRMCSKRKFHSVINSCSPFPKNLFLNLLQQDIPVVTSSMSKMLTWKEISVMRIEARRIVEHKVIDELLRNGTYNLDKNSWMRLRCNTILKRLHHFINPFMLNLAKCKKKSSCVDCKTGMSVLIRTPPLTKCHMDFPSYPWPVTFVVQGRPKTVVTLANDLKEKESVFLSEGAVVSNPTLRNLLHKFNSCVPSLKFKSSGIKSQGIILGRKFMESLFPNLSTAVIGQDVTRILSLCKKLKRKSSKASNLVPFDHRCILSLDELRGFVPEFLIMSPATKIFFYLVFWDIGDVKVRHWRGNGRLCEHLNRWLESILHGPALLKRQIARIKFWKKLHPIQNFLIPRARAIISLVHHLHIPSFWAVVEASTDPDQIKEMLNILHDEKVILHPIWQGIVKEDTRMMFMPGIPAPLKRLMYDSMIRCRVTTSDGFMETKYQYVHTIDKFPRIGLRLSTCNSEYKILYLNRYTGIMCEESAITEFRGTPQNPKDFDLRFFGELGAGQAVFDEVLHEMWKTAVNLHLFSMQKDGLCVTPDAQETFVSTMFSLGFVSGLCVARGVYLPFIISKDMWDFIFWDIEFEVPYRIIFSAFSDITNRTKDMSDHLFRTTFGFEDEYELNEQKREEILDSFSIPNRIMLRSFKDGWNTCAGGINLGSISNEASMILCAPRMTTIDANSFESVFQINSPMDTKFIQVVHTLAREQIETLVKFITGSERLPCVELGSPMINAIWNGVGCEMPIAQNCTNTIVFPQGTTDILESIQPILKFSSILGFT